MKIATGGASAPASCALSGLTVALALLSVCLLSSCASNIVPSSTASPGAGPAPTPTQSQLTLTSVSPDQVQYPITGSVTLTLTGNDFTSQSSAVFNGTQLTTTGAGVNQLSAVVPSTLIPKPGSFTVYVWDSSNHTDVSNSLSLEVKPQTPSSGQITLTSVSPDRVQYPANGKLTLKLTGTGFSPQSGVVFNGTELVATKVEATHILATLPSSLIPGPGSFTVYVWDNQNHGDKSNSLSLNVIQKASFTLGASPASLNINQWMGGQSTVTLTPQDGFSGDVTLSVSGMPQNVTASVSPSGTNTWILAVEPTDDVQPGSATLTISASSTTNAATTSVALSLAELPVVRDENGYCTAAGNWTGPGYDGLAQLPQTCFYTDLSATPSPGQMVTVSSGGDLQAALNGANCGDTITLQAGASFQFNGNALPSKRCDDQHWITVRTSSPDSSLPPEHSRINPSYAGIASLPSRPPFSGGSGNVMAQILETSTVAPLIPGDHYRFIGIEITRPQNRKWYNSLVEMQTSKVIFDRCWIHGDSLDETTHLVGLGHGNDHIAVIDSYLDDAHCTAVTGACLDSQAIGGNDGGSALKIVNNFLEAAGENILFGGGAATAITSDIEIRLNHLFKPLSWNPDDPSFIGTKFIVKNNFELKESQRILVEGNILENTWGGFTQSGASILITPKNQAGKNGSNLCPICLVADVTLRYNYVHHGATAVNVGIGQSDNHGWAAGAYDFSFHDSIFDGMQYSECYDCSRFTNQIGSGYNSTNPPPAVMYNVSLDHITLVNSADFGTSKQASGFLLMDGPPKNNSTDTPQISNLQLTNSIMDAGNSGAYPTGGGANNCSVGQKTVADKIAACWTGQSSFTGNVLIVDEATQTFVFPAGNQTSPTWDDVGFVNFNGGDGGNYLLGPTSPYKGSATDGTDPGADVVSVMAPVPAIE